MIWRRVGSWRRQVKKRRDVVAFPIPRKETCVRGLQRIYLAIRFKLGRGSQRADNVGSRIDFVLMGTGIGFRGKGLVTALMCVDMGVNVKMTSEMQIYVMKMRALAEEYAE